MGRGRGMKAATGENVIVVPVMKERKRNVGVSGRLLSDYFTSETQKQNKNNPV